MLDSRTIEERNERLEQVSEHLHKRLKKAEAKDVDAFVRLFYAHVGAEDILQSNVGNLYGAAMAMWKFAQRRTIGEPRIRVYNPRVEDAGWKSPHTIIEIVNDDMPFLVDSVVGFLNTKGYHVHLIIHPILKVTRDAKGERKAVYTNGKDVGGSVRESMMHIEISEQTDPAVLDGIAQRLNDVLMDVRASVEDWQPMLGQLDDLIGELNGRKKLPLDAAEVQETREFLEWMRDDHFTFLGCRDYDYRQVDSNGEVTVAQENGLGILRDAKRHVLTPPNAPSEIDLSPIAQQFIRRPGLMLITKTSARGTVHRPVHMDYIGVKRYGRGGKVIGERRFVGLFTASAYNRTPRDIPLLRHKVDEAIRLSGVDASGHDGKALVHIIETYPRDELFQIEVETLAEIAKGILEIQERPHIRMFVRRDKFDRYFSILVYVPRERLSTELRNRYERILKDSLNGRVSNYYTQVGDSPLARMHYIIGINPPGVPDGVDYGAIEQRLTAAARSWHDDLYDALVDRWGEERGARLAARYGEGFPTSYAESFDAELALSDIERIEALGGEDTIALDFYRTIEDPDHTARFKIFHPTTAVPLSDCLPMLENMGLKVMGESPHRLRLSGDEEVWVHDFLVEDPQGAEIDLSRLKGKFEEAFARIWAGEVENDGFNRLVLRGGLSWREVVVLRAYCKYLRQTGMTFSQDYLESTLANHPEVARLLVDLFVTRLDPAGGDGRDERIAAIEIKILGGLEAVASLDEDRILRRYLNLMQSTLRTNFFQPTADGTPKSYLSFKLDSLQVAELPKPRPFREIFVYAPRVEGVHLRGGKVARGGLRWSDRREDFRTEVLGLMKAQMVKNAVIVPVGSKGGFVPKRLPQSDDRDVVMAEVVECYKTFIRGLLDLTDNRIGDAVVPPEHVVRFDDDDPYLVVAADKGTATFSDIANGVALDYGFWLGDAFASGGAKGYDHKAMGITARGAWESVKRHFREMNRDIQNEPFTVIGVGDMSGDVFGNGMLLSRHTRLMVAFDHRHIFVDPDPDTEKSWHERKRLFELPRSSWDDYDKSLISKGGGVFDRRTKSIKLTPQIKQMAGLSTDSATPAELINALLRAEADLLWFGGIGTYVRATTESDDAVGDRANDAIRVTAPQLRVKVVGEGANLGVTQLARIEFASRGGRINTDAVDNAAGVDCSDHEVNIKILVDSIVSDGEMTAKQRDRLLSEMTDEVGDLVLQDNYLQTQTLTALQSLGPTLLESHARFMRELERKGALDRQVEFLPDEEVLAEREAAGRGLTRPELAVLVAYAKMSLFEQLLASDLTDSSALTNDLVKYFPRPLRRRHRDAILSHRLRDEIIATVTANSIVNRVGITFMNDMIEETGETAGNVSRCYTAARELFGLRAIWNGIEALDNKVPSETQVRMIVSAAELMRRATLWFLRNVEQPLRITKVSEDFGEGIAALAGNLHSIISETEIEAMQRRVAELQEKGVPEDLAQRVEGLLALGSGCDIVHVAKSCGRPVEDVGRVYFTVGARLGLDQLRQKAEAMSTDDHWHQAAITSIIEDLYGQQRALSNAILGAAGDISCEAAVDQWCQEHSAEVARNRGMLEEFEASGGLDIAKLALANRYMRRFIVEAA